jgi:hypothetical protein
MDAMKPLAGMLAALALCALPVCAEAATPKAAPRVGLVPADSKLLVVFANPGEGQDAAFNTYYDTHMQQFMKLPNFVRVQKFKMLSRKGRPDPQYKYMLIFEFKGDQDESFARIQQWIKDGKIDMAAPGVVAKLEGTNYGADGVGYRGPASE